MQRIHYEDKNEGSKRVPLPDRRQDRETGSESISAFHFALGSIKSGEDVADKLLREIESLTGCPNGEMLHGVEGLADVI